MVNLSEQIAEIIVRYAQAKGVKRPVLQISDGSKNGDSFSGDITRVLVQDGDQCAELINNNISPEDPCGKQLYVIVKTPPTNEMRRQMYNSVAHFNRESYVYEHILPTFESFQKFHLSPDHQPFMDYPTILATSTALNNEFVILKDLLEQGFQNAPKSTALDFDKCTLVMQHLAHLHAISFAMKDQEPEKFVEITVPLTEIMFLDPVNQHLQTFLEKQVDYGLTTLGTDSKDSQVVRSKLLQFQKNFGQIMAECVGNKEDAVVTHGDCWISNIMFGESKSGGLKFIDWQVSRLASVVVDISYFIFCCTDSHLRQRLPDLLKIYHAALVSRIDAFGSDGSKLFCFQRLETHMKKYAKFGLGMALMTLHSTCCADLPFNVTETLDTIDLNQLESIGLQLIVRPEYISRMSGVLHDMVKFGYL